MSKRTCEELGVCQDRAECHLPCSAPPSDRFPFAPGVIDLGEPPVSRMDVLGGVLLVLATLGAVAAVVGFASGYISVGALLP